MVSSNGTQAWSAIIWAVSRPTNGNAALVNLYAHDATASGGTLVQLFSAPAGSWPAPTANANIVPVVANGKVYVASNQSLTIFGSVSGTTTPQAAVKPSPVEALGSPHVISGIPLVVTIKRLEPL